MKDDNAQLLKIENDENLDLREMIHNMSHKQLEAYETIQRHFENDEKK